MIFKAAASGSVKVVRWLLDHGAAVNHEIDGKRRCFALTGAVVGGHIEVVKLLVEQGDADINAVWADQNALSLAEMYRQNEIAAYLRSKGAALPEEDVDGSPNDEVLEHLTKYLGQPLKQSIREIVPSPIGVKIHLVDMREMIALVTDCDANRSPIVAKSRRSKLAEYIIYLPPEWDLSLEAIRHDYNGWPISWLREAAQHLGASSKSRHRKALVVRDAVAPNTLFTAFVLVQMANVAKLKLRNGNTITYYTLIPLYEEEADLEKERGTAELLRLFKKNKIGFKVNVSRQNVASGI